MARAIIGNRRGNEYMLHDGFRAPGRAMCETCMNLDLDQTTDFAALNIEARGSAPALRVSRLLGGANRSFLVECGGGGGKYAVKQSIHKHREDYLKRFIFGSASRRTIDSMRKALARGCDAFQKIVYIFEFPFLLEKRRCMEMWSVSEFIEGAVVSSLPNKRDFMDKILAALSEIARNGVFQTDSHSGNFILAENGALKVLDLRLSNTPALAQVWKMAYECRRTFGMSMPTPGFGIMEKAAAFLGDRAFSAFGKRCEFS